MDNWTDHVGIRVITIPVPYRVLIFRDREAICFLLLNAGARVTPGITEHRVSEPKDK